MPGIRQQRQNFFRYHTLLHALNQLIKARHTAFHRRNNIARQHLRQIVEKATEEIAHDTFITGTQLNSAKITHNRYQQLMPHDGGFRNTWRLRPTLLEAQLADKVDKLAAFTFKRQLLNRRQIIMILQLVFYNSFGILTAVNAFIEMINQLKFPLRCQIMGSAQNLFFHSAVLRVLKIELHFFHKIFLNIRNPPPQLLINPGIKLLAINTHHFMENLRLNVSQHVTLQKLKNAALYQQTPVELCTMVILLMAGKHIHNHHLVSLLIKLCKAAGTDMLIPALDMRCIIQKFNKAFGQHCFISLINTSTLI